MFHERICSTVLQITWRSEFVKMPCIIL